MDRQVLSVERFLIIFLECQFINSLSCSNDRFFDSVHYRYISLTLKKVNTELASSCLNIYSEGRDKIPGFEEQILIATPGFVTETAM